jgi:glycosyltransferase involved in cell wall biosynthesis
MRIAIDTRDLLVAKTGTRTYLSELCRVMPMVAPEHQFIFLSPFMKPPAGNSILHKILGHISFFWWKEIALPLSAWFQKCDVILCTDYVVPLFSHCVSVPVFHDSSFWNRPQDYNWLWRSIFTYLARAAAKKAPIIITESLSSRKSLVMATGFPAEKFAVIYLAPKNDTLMKVDQYLSREILSRYLIPAGVPFILHVGVMEKRKNLVRLVDAFSKVRPKLENNLLLVLIGQKGPKIDSDDSKNIENAIRRNGVEKFVILPGYVPDNELPSFYQNASLYAFPSLREGFGLPALEAFANGVPLIAANASSLPEVVGDAALLFNPEQPEEIEDAILRVVSDMQLRKDLVERGHKQLGNYSWEKTARQILTIIETVVQ